MADVFISYWSEVERLGGTFPPEIQSLYDLLGE